MDTTKLIQEARSRFKHHENKLYLQEKYCSRLTIPNQGGLWNITPEFLAFLSTAPSPAVIKDSYGNPVRVDTAELCKAAWSTYNTVMDEWNSEWLKLQSNR